MDNPDADNKDVFISPASHPLAVGDPNEDLQPPEEVAAVMSIFFDNNIQCCFVQEYALIYCGTTRAQRDRVICIRDEQFDHAVDLFSTRSDILAPCGLNPLRFPDLPNHKYPRFKAIGWATFWLLVPGNYCHITVEPENIEWSGLPYPKLPIYVQSAIDSDNQLDLAELIDGMDLSEEWGYENLDLEGDIDTEWLKERVKALKDDEPKPMFIFVTTTPVPRSDIWIDAVRNKQKRMGWKYPVERYASKYRKHGSKDPRLAYRPGL
ncbi:hypothetical protein BO71DRAFT_330956 [Aspergillus ellipticus CBS 707.79]|uniref:Uncharacterized protein n=1 Tax=Aspergillus ellipticus CBS 707.79 TaxID=1448320 RepID=A0A319D3G2_9EURO|nr:hypothetical protein BO71DRAFT_330956 [Aspergillus ellipticus CBS 707.79]